MRIIPANVHDSGPFDELIDAVWPFEPPSNAGAALSTLLSQLRAVLGTGVVQGRSELQLHLVPGSWIDIEAASEAIARAEAALSRAQWQDAWAPANVARAIAERGFLSGYDAPWIDTRRRAVEELHVEALECLAAALRADPACAPAMAATAYCRAQSHFQGWTRQDEPARAQALALAWRAVELAPGDAQILWMAAFAVWNMAQDGRDRARDLFRRSLLINPNYNGVYATSSNANSWYNGFVVTVNHRYTNWFEGSANYTWSHAEDSNLGGAGGAP